MNFEDKNPVIMEIFKDSPPQIQTVGLDTIDEQEFEETIPLILEGEELIAARKLHKLTFDYHIFAQVNYFHGVVWFKVVYLDEDSGAEHLYFNNTLCPYVEELKESELPAIEEPEIEGYNPKNLDHYTYIAINQPRMLTQFPYLMLEEIIVDSLVEQEKYEDIKKVRENYNKVLYNKTE